MDALMNTEQAAAKLGFAPATLERWRSQGVGPAFVRVNRAVKYRQVDLDRWVEGHLVEASA